MFNEVKLANRRYNPACRDNEKAKLRKSPG